MIPTEEEAKKMWDVYHLPENKRIHVALVARVALFFAKKIEEKKPEITINKPLLVATALLHDIDKTIPRKPGEQHPDTAVRVLKEAGMIEVADIVKTHPLHSVLDLAIAPKTWEEKLLYLADKMVKYEVITVDKRFALWNDEHLPPQAQHILDTCYPKVKALEHEILTCIGVRADEVAKFVSAGYTIRI